jgi:hypothetical protein
MSILKEGKILGKTVAQGAEMIGGFPSMGIQARNLKGQTFPVRCEKGLPSSLTVAGS